MAAVVMQDIDLKHRVLDNLSTTVLLFNKHLCLHYLNPAAESLFEISARRLLGLSVSQLLGNSETIEQMLSEALESNHAITQRETTIELSHGRKITVDLTVTPLIESHKTQEVLVEMAQLDRLLRISRDEDLLSQHNAVQEILRGLAHEVKNPLGGLHGAAQLLERQLKEAELKEYTQIIISEADRLQNLVNRMLGPNALPNMQWTNIHEILERVRHLVAVEVGDRIPIKRDYDPSIPEFQADQDQLIQAVLNLLRNAAQSIDTQGTILLRTSILRQFTIGHIRHKLVAKIEIIDDGPGVPPEIRAHIFYPMVTGRAEGSGLGLSIAQSLIQQHGGLIECQSIPGNTVFSLLLPLEKDTRGGS